MAKISTKILLIEDDIPLTEMYKMRFKGEGIDLLMASDGQTGLDIANKEKLDLILLDIMMPKLDGFAVIKKLKASSKTKNIPVIMLSNLGQVSDIIKGKKLGANDYIVKSLMTPSQIIDKVKKYFK